MQDAYTFEKENKFELRDGKYNENKNEGGEVVIRGWNGWEEVKVWQERQWEELIGWLLQVVYPN